jgi:hypothetical protein
LESLVDDLLAFGGNDAFKNELINDLTVFSEAEPVQNDLMANVFGVAGNIL